MEQDQKKVHIFDRFFTNFAVKYLVKDEQDPMKQIERGQQKVAEIKKQAIYLFGLPLSGLHLAVRRLLETLPLLGVPFCPPASFFCR